MRAISVIIRLLLILLILASCGHLGSQTENSLADLKVIYQREGGFAGLSQEWTLYPDGRIKEPGGDELQVPAEDAVALFAIVGGASFSNLKDSYIPKDNCCDQFTYTITVIIGSTEKSVSTSDSGSHPEMVSQVITAIEDLIQEAKPVE